MKPLDIDGNELKVGDDVIFEKDGTRAKWGAAMFVPVGASFVIQSISGPHKFKSGIIDMEASLGLVSIACSLLRKIQSDQKAPTLIEFVVNELTK